MGFLAELSTPAISAIPAISAMQRGVSAGSSAPNSGNSRNSRVRQSQLRVQKICDAIAVSYDDIARRIDFGAVADCHDRLLARLMSIRWHCESIGKPESSQPPTQPPRIAKAVARRGARSSLSVVHQSS